MPTAPDWSPINPAGAPARLLHADDEHAEAEFIANQIGSLVDRGLLEHPGHAAVLYRTRAQVDILASALRSAGVPYAMRGHADLFRQRVVRDILAYVRLAYNPGDRLALARALEAPPRGLGRLAAVLVDEPATTLVELPSLADAFGPAIKAGAAALVATVYALHADAVRGGSPAALLDRAMDQTGYRAWLERHPDGPARLRTIARLRAIAQRAEVGLGEWLDALASGEDVDPIGADQEATRLSSIHTAKGREWRVVFLPGLEESVLPHYRALRGRDGKPDEAALEEELRVLYVAFTRPRERLYLSYCRERSRGGQMETRHPSRWLYALPPELLAPAALPTAVRPMASLIGGNRIDTDTLKLAHPIGEVVARYGIELKRQGRAMVGRCIFHPDGGRPNLYIYADSESWRCYRCGIGGDVLAFIMHAEDIGFREAVDRLTGGQQGPVRATPRPAPAPHETSKRPNDRTADELAVLQAATNFYHSNLLAEPRALDYLAQRGISVATARQYRLGYAAGDQLLPLLHWQRLPLGAALHLGLLTRAGHEFMADRIVIPELCAGQPVWLIGRALREDLADDVPKYLGLPGAKPLLGWDQARGSTTVCVVEGVFDVLTVRQWGYPVLGLLGTSVRPDQIDHLRAFARSYLVLDTDDAGVEATLSLQESIGSTAVARRPARGRQGPGRTRLAT